MKPHAYYNEIDPYAALWIENLILEGVIAYGDVDRRSIEDVRPSELAGYTQCHFFAGLGGWSYALRLAGWPDERPVWTGSCPCQPFSAAGKSAGFADERHLWPAWHWLITQCRPDTIFGEQVASPAALAWIDLVSTDLENSQYACAPEDLCAASIGTPHIRQRLYWVADNGGERRLEVGADAGRRNQGSGSQRLEQRSVYGGAVGLGDAELPTETRQRQHGGQALPEHEPGISGPDGASGLLGNSGGGRSGRDGGTVSGAQEEGGSGGETTRCVADKSESAGADGELGNPGSERQQQHAQRDSEPLAGAEASCGADARGPSPWADVDWLPCRDGKWRPVEPGTFPLAHGVPARVGRLRAYGNAICAPLAAEFIRAYREC